MAKAKGNTADDLRQLTANELKAKLVASRKALFDLRIKRSELKNLLELRSRRRDVARILTIMKEKEISGKTAKEK